MANTRSLPSPAVSWQPSLLDAAVDAPAVDSGFAGGQRVALDAHAWVDHVPGWVCGAGALFAAVVGTAPWEQRRVHMYDRMVDEPRLTAWWETTAQRPEGSGAWSRPRDDGTVGFVAEGLPPVVREMATALSARYERDFDSVGAALYRDGRDSVAWHGDRIAPEIVEPVVAVVSLGSPRGLRMRRKTRHTDTRLFRMAPGDLFVMGGTSQRTWEHSIPKVARAGPRLSLQFRHSR